ncbi:elongation factor 1 alpha-like protein [Paragonimus westermani]|uniref:Elongation factor 1 alpha-like protein n=1 Tax=Paragonimus westermani TaxID=34504 RepID=A0A5J4P040_9TREM|nr:elongation factor 1 alpha-like protein [Paragonimus westermani]
MSRHRNIRQLGLDAATYLYDSSTRGTHSFAVFAQGKADSFEFSVEDFPVNEDAANTSPGHVTGRIQSNGFKFADDQSKDRAAILADMELNELMVGGSDYPRSDNSTVAADASFLDPAPRDLSVPVGALVEIDFDSLEKLTSYPDRTKHVNAHISSLSSISTVPNFSNACSISSPALNILKLGPHYEGTITTNFTSRRIEILSASSKLSTTHHTAASGIKESSRLGSSLLLTVKQHKSVSGTKVDSLLLNSLKVFVRSRTTSTYAIASIGCLTVNFFRFDVPEPVTFDRRRAPTQTKHTTVVPREDSKPLVTVRSQNIEPQKPLAPDCRDQATPTALAQTLSERLELSHLRERTPARCNALAGSTTTSSGKPIDRKPLLNEYLERQKNSNKKEVINLIVVEIRITVVLCSVNLTTRNLRCLNDIQIVFCVFIFTDAIPAPERAVDGPFRFVVSDIFKPDGLSVPAIAGRVISGAVSAGVGLATSRVFCQPSGLPATVKSIRSLCNVRSGSESGDGEGSGNFLDQVVKFAFAGDQVALILTGVDPFQSLVPGDLLTDPDNPVSLASRIQAKILVFSVPQPITRGYPVSWISPINHTVIFYYHCTSVSANLVKLKSMTHKENKIEKTIRKPRCLQSHCTADVEITLDRPVCLEVYDKCKPLGRFMLRVGGESIAGGTVTSVLPPKKNRLADM